jgi:hypothetical protein
LLIPAADEADMEDVWKYSQTVEAYPVEAANDAIYKDPSDNEAEKFALELPAKTNLNDNTSF